MTRLRQPIVWVCLLALLALVLGYVGHRALTSPDLSRSDALFSAIQLFVLEGGVPADGTPLALEIARFLSPAVVAYATILALVALLRDQVQRAMVTGFAHDHVVVVGLGSGNTLLAQALHQRGLTTVAIESDSANPRIPALRDGGIRVVVGDAGETSALRQVRATRARHLVVGTGSDDVNLRVTEQIVNLVRAEGSPDGRTTVHVEIRDHQLWGELGRLALSGRPNRLTFEFFNLSDRAAQALLDEVERQTGLDTYRRVLLDGDGAMAERTLTHLLRRAFLAGYRPQIHLTERTAARVLDPLLQRDPGARDTADFQVMADVSEGDGVPLALVCADGSDAVAIGRALGLARPSTRGRVFVGVGTHQSTDLLATVGVSDIVKLVPAGIEAVTDSFLRLAGHEVMARARHEHYLATELAHGHKPEDNASLVPWDVLPESLKDSNRRFAQAVGDVIGGLGGVLAPLRTVEPVSSEFVADGTLEQLAKREHDRWMRDLLNDGWVHDPGPKNPHTKTHPLLVDWSELPEAEREKDRDAIRAIPEMLARAGYGLEFPASSEAEARQPERPAP